MRRWRVARRILPVALAACIFCCTVAQAKKPDNPGGGGGGSDDSPPPRFTVVEIPVDGDPVAMSERDANDAVTVAINSHEAGRVSAAFARVNLATREVIDSGYLPEPLFVAHNGEVENGPSVPNDVNDFGDIVGFADAFDPTLPPDVEPSPSRAALWTPTGQGYAMELLPSLDPAVHTTAYGINNLGDVVGGSDNCAVRWDAESHALEDLNTTATAEAGWDLQVAFDINDEGLIVGQGILDGKQRGFLLIPELDLIWAVPLVGPADANTAYRINAAGRVVGSAWEGQGVHYGTDPDYVRGYTWDGPGSDAVVLTPVTTSTSLAVGMNDLGASVGTSWIPNDDMSSYPTDHQVPTLWEFNEQGEIVGTDLNTEIPDQPSWFLLRAWDVTNDGWVSAFGRKRVKGQYLWRALLLEPNGN